MKTQISLDTLKASIHCAATKDVRYYLNGVLFDTMHGVDSMRIVSTDGTVLSMFVQELPDHPDSMQVIVPLEIIKQACSLHKKAVMIDFECNENAYKLGGIEFTPVDGTYPDYTRVIPNPSSITQESKGIQYNPELLLRGKKALDNFYGGKKGFDYRLDHNAAGGPGVMHRGESKAIVCVMPCRAEEYTYTGL